VTIEIIDGCLITAFEKGEVNIIGHVTNSRGVMGSGVAKAIRDRYPEVYEEYIQMFSEYGSLPERVFGIGQEVSVANWNRRLVFNLHAQLNYGSKTRDLNYGAFASALGDMRCMLLNDDIIGFPYLIGCDRAKGDWSIVLEIIEHYFKDHQVKIYRLNK
jgi:hypothetical protein